jgi:phosphoserine phosphatase
VVTLDGWTGSNRDRLNQLVTEIGISSASYSPDRRPVAVFDWDNTTVKNDIGDATFAWLVKNDKILQPPALDWSATNTNLTPEARAALNAACDASASPGQPLPTSTTAACAAELMNVYYNAKTTGGLAAWNNEITSTSNQPYGWVAQLLAGYTPDEVRGFAQAAFLENVNAAVGTKQTVGGVELAGYIRIYEQIRELINVLQDNGFDVWVVTASPQHVVDAISRYVGVEPDHVIGIRTLEVDGKGTYDLEGCGTVKDGDNTLITFYNGKRCFINKVIFGGPAATQLDVNPDPAKRPAFVAGDSNTDVAMLKDASHLKLAIDRNKVELMCNAYANYMNRWLIQPMFISPKTVPASYACSTTLNPDGIAIVDEANNPIPDQVP